MPRYSKAYVAAHANAHIAAAVPGFARTVIRAYHSAKAADRLMPELRWTYLLLPAEVRTYWEVTVPERNRAAARRRYAAQRAARREPAAQ
jgi:hypothetical protein